MGLPEVLITFKSKAVSAVKRSERGVVALLLQDEIQEKEQVVYKGVDELKAEDWSEDNYGYIDMALQGNPNKVIAVVCSDYTEGLQALNNIRFDYLAIPGITTEDTQAVVTWVKGQRKESADKRTVKAVLPNTVGDSEGVINFTTEGIQVNEKDISTAAFTARIAGVLAGLPFTRSATYYKFPEVDKVEPVEDAGEAIDAGELILIDDGRSIKIGRGVNSLTELEAGISEDFKSIRVVEVMDMIYNDIKEVFEDEYIGKLNNTYDNQVLFITAINGYLNALEGEGVLDSNFDNRAEVDASTQRLAWEGIGVDTEDWDDEKVKSTSFKRNVYLAGSVKIVDTMEDLKFSITI